LIEDIERAIRELDLINQRAPSSERLSLLGGACKRLAWVHTDAQPRLEALSTWPNYYRQAHELDLQKAREKSELPNPYHFTNWAMAKVLSELLDSAQDKSLA